MWICRMHTHKCHIICCCPFVCLSDIVDLMFRGKFSFVYAVSSSYVIWGGVVNWMCKLVAVECSTPWRRVYANGFWHFVPKLFQCDDGRVDGRLWADNAYDILYVYLILLTTISRVYGCGSSICCVLNENRCWLMNLKF